MHYANRRSDDVACITACAKATYERLPPELRNLVYEYLWGIHGDSATNIFEPPRTSASTAFITPDIVGNEFVREAVVWMYEHGCAGHAVSLPRLGAFLFTDAYRVGAVPAACSLRALNVRIDCHLFDGPPISASAVESQFAPLLCLGLMRDFKMLIRIVITFEHCIYASRLSFVSTSIKNVVRDFRSKQAKIAIEFEIKQESPVIAIGRMASFTGRSYSEPLLAHHRIQGQVAEQMLNATPIEWSIYLYRQLGFNDLENWID
jgi:hypothetical protein